MLPAWLIHMYMHVNHAWTYDCIPVVEGAPYCFGIASGLLIQEGPTLHCGQPGSDSDHFCD